jgi:hypothetical protein
MNRASGSADPFASQRGIYQDQLRQSYQDPTKIWDSPAWQSLRKRMLEDSTAKDAAAGRLTDFGNRDERVGSYFMGEYLPKLQQSLQMPAGANSNPSAPGNIISQMAGGVAGAQGQQSNALGYLLNSLFTGNQPSTIDRIFGGAPAQNDNLFQQLWKMMNSGNNTSYQDYQ